MRTLVIALMLVFSAASLAAESHLRWYRGNTRTHTRNSASEPTPATVAQWYREHDYQFLFITDPHYRIDPARLNLQLGATERFLLLPGQAITQWSAGGARSFNPVNGLFIDRTLGAGRCMDSGCGAQADGTVSPAETLRAAIAAVLKAGGIVQINHPNYQWAIKPEDLYAAPNGTLLEIWNGQKDANSLGGSTDVGGDNRPSAEGYWDILLSRGKIIWGVASDDSHHDGGKPDDAVSAGQAWIMVRAPVLTASAVEAALRSGYFYASTGVTLTDIAVVPARRSVDGMASGPSTWSGWSGARVGRRGAAGETLWISIQERAGAARYLTRFIGPGGRQLAEVPGTHPFYLFKGNEGYVRAAVMDSNGNRAWTQPVFTDDR